MKAQKAYSRSDVVAVLACVAFLLINLGAIGNVGRSRAKEAVCKANLHKWSLVFSQYAADYEGYNPYGGWASSWWEFMLPYVEPNEAGRNLFLCPTAVKKRQDGGVQPFMAFDYGTAPQRYGGGRYVGSYGVNPWIFSRTDVVAGGMFGGTFNPAQWRWRRCNVAGAENVPVFGDCVGPGAGGRENDPPPSSRDSESKRLGGDRWGIGAWCVDRHDCAMNMLYMDWSVRRTNLKCLWKLKWHREFNTANSGPSNAWPEWMSDCPGCD